MFYFVKLGNNKGVMEENKIELNDRILAAIESKNAPEIREIFETIPNIDIADAIDEIEDPAVLLFIFRTVPSEYTAEFFVELTIEQQELLINAFSDEQLIRLLNDSFADDIVDTLEELPANVVTRILRVCPKDMRADVNRLLNYKEDTAGSLMTTEYISLHNNLSVKDAIKEIREKGRDAETVYTVFVRDDKRTLVGTINLDDLIFAKEDELLDDIMDRDFVTCHVNDDQEEVANMFKRYDLTAMAVTTAEGKIVGIITVDDVVDIIVEEATEDMAHMNAVSNMEDPYLKTPILKLVWKCVPWIVCLMLLQIGSAFITSSFDYLIESCAILAVFSPLILDAGGNSGGQTTTLIVRSLALDEFEKGDFKKVLWKELRVAFIIASIIGVFATLWTFFEISVLKIGNIPEQIELNGVLHTVTLGGVSANFVVSCLVGSTLFVTMIISRMIGCCLPFLAKKIHVDPAVMCGPFTTTVVDVISLLTYFLLWSNVFAPLLFK